MKTYTKGIINKVVKFTDTVRERGIGLENRVEQYLISMGIPYERAKKEGIDFIINGLIYLDCIAQGVSGSIGDKLPHKCWKYIRKYNLKDIYILHPYSPISKTVGEHLADIELRYECNIHLLDWNDFTYICNGGKFEKRQAYTYSKDSKSISNLAPNNYKINQFFKFNN